MSCPVQKKKRHFRPMATALPSTSSDVGAVPQLRCPTW